MDHLYGYVVLDEEIIKLLERPEFYDEILRLGEISHLGLIGKIFRLARHSKWEHCVGLYHLTRRFKDINESKHNIGDIHGHSLLAAAILHGIGHLPIAYPSEWAVLTVFELEPGKCKEIVKELQRVERMICKNCVENCRQRIFSERRVQELVWWLSAAKVAKVAKASNWFKKQQTFDVYDIIKYMVCPKKLGCRLLRDLDVMDFVQRDLFNLALANVKIHTEHLFDRISIANDQIGRRVVFPPEWSLIEDLHRYLDNNVYYHPAVQAAEMIWAKTLTCSILDERLSFQDLIDKTDEAAIAIVEQKCRKNLRRFAGISKAIERCSQEGFVRPSSFSRYFGSDKSLTLLESEFIGLDNHDWPRLDKQEGVYVMMRPDKDEEDIFHADIVCDDVERNAAHYLRTVGRLSEPFGEAKIDRREEIMGWLFGGKASIDWLKYRNLLKPAIESYADEEHIDYRLDYFLTDEDLAYMLYCDRMRHKLPDDHQENIERFTVICLQYASHLHSDAYEGIVSRLPRTSNCEGELRSHSLELRPYLRNVIRKVRKKHFHWHMPSLTIEPSGSQKTFELDGVSVEVGIIGPARVRLYMCTISGSSGKEEKDTLKLKRASDILEDRFGNSLDVFQYFNGQLIKGPRRH